MKAALPTFLFLSCLSPALAAPDMYLAWATSKWGTATTGSVVQRSVTWGEEADPDRDGIANLIEYACDTDPTRHNPASDCWQFFLPDSGAAEYRYPQITAHLRTDDPDLRVLAQTSQDLSFWSPQASSVDFSQPQPVNPAVWEQATGSTLRGLRQMRYIDHLSMAHRSRAFMRLHVVRRFASASTTPIEPFAFTPGQTVATGSTARSSSITLAGFVGTLSASIPAGATLFVNGTAQTGSTATVKAGDVLWMQATAPGIAGLPRNHTLTIGGQAATWSFTAGSIAAVPDHPGTDSGYTPVETGVSDTGAAQISIPIVVSPGTAGMQPKLSINYSSQGGNGPLGVGFSLSGLSSISRVGRTVAQDGVKGGVNFDANDRFALDGQRLIAINGADGADGTEYRLEFDPTSRIRSYGTEGSGPQRWVVETKAGLKMEFEPAWGIPSQLGKANLEIYRTIPGASLSSLESSPKFPSAPDQVQTVSTVSNTLTENDVGYRLSGFYIPKTTGSHQFHIATDNEGKLLFDPTGVNPTSPVLSCTSNTTSHFAWGAASPSYTLVAGVPYRFELRHKGDYATNHYSIGVRRPGEAVAGLFRTDEFAAAMPNAAPALALSWRLHSITDTSANSMRLLYDELAANRGELLVTKIEYTSNLSTGLSPNQEVVFEYEDRPDVRTAYFNGLESKNSKRLKAIESRATQQGLMRMVRRYVLNYRVSSTSSKSLLTQVVESSITGNPHTTTLTWGDSTLPNMASSRSSYPPYPTEWRSEYVQVGDVNGDGLSDMVTGGNDGKLTVFVSLSSGGFQTVRIVADKGFNQSEFWLGDFNGDGHTDILTRPDTATRVVTYFGKGDGTFSSVSYNQAVEWDRSHVQVGDYDGDGRTDFMVRRGVEGNITRFWRCFLSNGDGSYRTVVFNNTFNWDSVTQYPGDFNGDGKVDFLTFNPSGSYFIALISNGDGTFTETPHYYDQSFFVTNGRLLRVGDFNGDGITDAVFPRGNNEIITYFFDGKAGVRVVSSGVLPNAFDWQSDIVGDLNGDGFLDIFTNLSGSDRLIRFYGDGKGGYSQQLNPSGAPWLPWNWWLGDFDGDGKTDFTSASTAGGDGFSNYRSSSLTMDLVAQVANQHGGSTQFNFQPLCWSGVPIHIKGTGNTYPCNDIQTSMYAVASIISRNGIDGDGFNQPPVSPVGENTVNYRYEGAWSCLDGRGFMGFKAVETTDATSGIVTRTVFEDRPLYAGRAKHAEQRLLTAPPGGNTFISESDTTWALAETTHPTGRKSYFITEAGSVSKSYEVNKPGGSALVKTVTRSGPGAGGSVTYDGNGNLLVSTTSSTDGAQTFTETVANTYSDTISPTQWLLGRLVTSAVTKTGPNSAGAGTESLTRSSSFAYHPTTGLLTQEVIEPSGGILRQQKDYTHDGFGNILTSTISTSGAASRTTTTTYTPDGRFVETTTNALNHTETKTYDPLLGNVLTQTGPNNLTTTWNYDAIGRPIQENRPDGTVTRSFYRRVTGSTVGAPPRAVHYVRVQSSGGAPKTVWYDLLDREIRADGIAFDGRTVSSHKVFNNRGEVTHASQPYFAGDTPLYSQMLYDAVGREYQQTDPGNRVSKTTYDGLTTTVERNYNPAALTDFQKAVTVVNAMGWTVQSSQYLGTAAKTITRKYDPYGNLRFVTDPAGNTTELRYDVRGNKTWMSEPNSGVSTFTYNGFGELKTQTNAANQTTTLAYDRLGRVTSRTEPEGVTTFTYDTAAQGIGQLAREAGPGFERRYFYDALARPAATAETHGFHVFCTSRGYDLYSRPESVTYPSGFATRQVYNASGHLSEVQNGANPSTLYWRALQVNARGQVTQEALGNGIVTERAFEAETGVIQGITSTFGSSGDVQKLGFTFDLIGNLTERRDKRFSTHFVEGFGYDTLNRLQTVSTTGAAAVTCAYNDLGNLTSRSDVGTLNYASSGAGPHALTSVTGSSGGALNKTCGYDAKGNRTTDGGTVLDYSSFNKPTRIRKGGDTLSFDYGPDRALYRQTIFQTNGSGATSQTVREYIGGLYEREITSEGLVRHIHHIAGGNGVVAIHTDERSAASAAQRTRFIHKDHLGSVDAITDSSGVVVERQSYDAWGRRRTLNLNGTTWTVTYPAAPGSAETHRGFTGHEMLDLVGLVHMGGRIYDPITARFLSPDPFVQSPDNLQNLNRYSYVLNNPLSFTDPSGFFFKSIGKFLVKAVKTFIAHAVGTVVGTVVGTAAFLATGNPLAFTIGFRAGYGFGSSFSGTLLAGGSVGDALRAGLNGARVGFAEGIINSALPAPAAFAAKAVVHGANSEANGGSFKHGFFGYVRNEVTSAAKTFAYQQGVAAIGRTVLGDMDQTQANCMGGTLSTTGGGKFANGAATHSFAMALSGSSDGADSKSTDRQITEQVVENAEKGLLFGGALAAAKKFATSLDISLDLRLETSATKVPAGALKGLGKAAARSPVLIIFWPTSTASDDDTYHDQSGHRLDLDGKPNPNAVMTPYQSHADRVRDMNSRR